MRTIKFRAFNKRLKQMFMVYSIDFDAGLVFCESESDTRHTFGMIDVELLQFTGIKDRSGADIYDKDVAVFFDMEAFCIERLENGEWTLKGLYEALDERSGEILVIGSAYTQPELLEQS